jgi:hypothetical protein
MYNECTLYRREVLRCVSELNQSCLTMCIVDFTKHVCLIRTQTHQFSPVFLSLTIRAVYADMLSFPCEQKHFQSCTNLLQFFFVTTWILCVLFLSRNDSGCSNHSHVFANLICFKHNRQEYSSEFTLLLLSLFSI